jgi:hypothetical protein
MANPGFLFLKLMGFAAAGIALGAGWKLGTYLVDTATGDTKANELIGRLKCAIRDEKDPLWKRKFSRISE